MILIPGTEPVKPCYQLALKGLAGSIVKKMSNISFIFAKSISKMAVWFHFPLQPVLQFLKISQMDQCLSRKCGCMIITKGLAMELEAETLSFWASQHLGLHWYYIFYFSTKPTTWFSHLTSSPYVVDQMCPHKLRQWCGYFLGTIPYPIQA